MKPTLTSEALLRKAGLRATAQRVKIVDLLNARHHPVSIEELVKAGRKLFDTTTAYRTLEVMKKKGIVRAIDLGQGRALYEMAEDHHHHAVCVSCGAIEDVSMCLTPALDEKVRKAVKFKQINTHALEFFGICNSCDA